MRASFSVPPRCSARSPHSKTPSLVLTGGTPSALRHPDKKSWSSFGELLGSQVLPIGIGGSHELILANPLPALELLLARDGVGRIFEFFDVYQTGDPIFLRKFASFAIAMLEGAPSDVVGHADIHGAERLT